MLFPFRNMRVSHVTKRLCKRLTSVPSQEHDSIFQPTLLRPHVPPLRTSVTSIFPDELCLHLALSSDVVPEAESPRVAIPTPPPRDLQGPGRANAAPASPGRVPTGRRPFPCPCSTLPWAQIKRSCLTLQGCRVPPAPGACLPASPHRPAALRHAFRSDGDTGRPGNARPRRDTLPCRRVPTCGPSCPSRAPPWTYHGLCLLRFPPGKRPLATFPHPSLSVLKKHSYELLIFGEMINHRF